MKPGRVFQEVAKVTGLVMTKLDGTAKGGVLVALADKFGIDSWLSMEQLEQQGELIFIFHSGLAPVKVEQFMSVPTGPADFSDMASRISNWKRAFVLACSAPMARVKPP